MKNKLKLMISSNLFKFMYPFFIRKNIFQNKTKISYNSSINKFLLKNNHFNHFYLLEVLTLNILTT